MSRGWRAQRRGAAVLKRATRLLVDLCFQWEQGLPVRTVARILRRQGIHPWSLLASARGEAWLRLAEALNAPAWITDASLLKPQGFTFLDLPKGRRLPEGLVTENLEVLDAPHLRRLPRRFVGFRIVASRCERLERLPDRVSGLRFLTLEDCPKLREIPAGLGHIDYLEARRCASLRRLQLAREADSLDLNHLPELQALPAGRTLETLRIWHCPRLETLAGVQVNRELWIHGCTRLASLPHCKEGIRGRVRDCPGLVAPDWPTSPDFEREAWEGPSFLPAPEPLRKGQGAVTQPLPGLIEPGEGPAWPWPPPGMAGPVHSEALLRTVATLGMDYLDRARCLAGCGGSLASGIRALLLGSEDPGVAVGRGASMLGSASRDGDLPAALALCLELEALGLGVLSAAMLMSPRDVQWLEPVLGREWCRHFQNDQLSVSDLGPLAEDLPGPLVLHPDWPRYPRIEAVLETWIEERPHLRKLGGPLWADSSLRIKDCPDLEELTGVMAVHGDLEVTDCPALRRFPGRVEVEGDLILARLPRLDRQVCRAEVGGRVRLEGVRGLRLLGSREEVLE